MSELIQNLEMYKYLIHELPEAAALSTLSDGTFVEVNDYLTDLFGFQRDQIIGHTSFDIHIWTDPNDRSRFKEGITRNSRGRDFFEFTFRHSSGDLITCLLSAKLLYIEDTAYILSILKNITPYKKTMQELEDSRERFRVLHEASFGGIAIHDRGIILEANAGLSSMTGYSHDELIGMNGLLLIAEESRPLVRKNITEHFEKPYEVKGVRKDGMTYDMLIQGKQIPYHGRNVRVTEFRDITEQKRQEEKQRRMEDQMLQIQKMDSIGILAGGIAHDFNNILTVISGHAELLISRLGENSSAFKSLSEIHKAALFASELTQNLLAFSRKQVYDPKVIDLNKTISGIYKILTRLISEDINVVLNLGRGAFNILADAHQIEQVLINLAINARDAIAATGSTAGKHITIETECVCLDDEFIVSHPGCSTGNHIMLSVSDEGTGMDEQTRLRIFEPFFTTKEQGKGTGLGLSTVYGIVQQNGGHITVYSEPGTGTVFRIYWPVTEQSQHACDEENESIDTLYGTENILIVEDDTRVRNFANDVLSSFGYTVTTAENGLEAIEKLEASVKTDIIISDVIMPGMNGPDFIERIRKEYPDIIVLFVSGYSANYILQKEITGESMNFLQKPYSATTLGRKVRELLDKRRN